MGTILRVVLILCAAATGGALWVACGGEGGASATTGEPAPPVEVSVSCVAGHGPSATTYAVASFPGKTVAELRAVRVSHLYVAGSEWTEATLGAVELADGRARVPCYASGTMLFTLP